MRVPGQRRLAFNNLKSFTFISFSSMYSSTIFIFSSGLSHGHSKRKMTPELFFSCIYRQKTYRSECPATHRAIAKVQFEIFYIHVIFEHVFINKKLPFQVVYLTGTQNRNIIYFLFFSSTVMKKTYESECPISVDWQSPDCESQILMVLS